MSLPQLLCLGTVELEMDTRVKLDPSVSSTWIHLLSLDEFMDSGCRQISFPLVLGDPTWEQSLGMLPNMDNREAKGGLSTGGKSSADVNKGHYKRMQRPPKK